MQWNINIYRTLKIHFVQFCHLLVGLVSWAFDSVYTQHIIMHAKSHDCASCTWCCSSWTSFRFLKRNLSDKTPSEKRMVSGGGRYSLLRPADMSYRVQSESRVNTTTDQIKNKRPEILIFRAMYWPDEPPQDSIRCYTLQICHVTRQRRTLPVVRPRFVLDLYYLACLCGEGDSGSSSFSCLCRRGNLWQLVMHIVMPIAIN